MIGTYYIHKLQLNKYSIVNKILVEVLNRNLSLILALNNIH